MKLAIIAVAVVGLLAVPTTRADSVTVGGPWYEFAYLDSGSAAFACAGACEPSSSGNSVEAGDPSWTFAATAPVLVTVTDAFFSGNSFELFDSGTLVGATPSVDLGYSCGDDPALCALDPNFSHSTFLLGAGDHSLTIDALDSPFGGGAAYFRIDAQTVAASEPSSIMLLALGLCCIGLLRLQVSRACRAPRFE